MHRNVPGMDYCDSPINYEINRRVIPVGEQTTTVKQCVRYE